jgi:hypothetical protein
VSVFCCAAYVGSWHSSAVPTALSNVGFSNRPFRVKRFQTIHHYSVDVAHGLVLLFGIGTSGPSIMGFEDEVEQSIGRPCRQTNGRSKRTCELTSSIVPRGTSFHRSVELECPSIGLDAARFSCCCCGLFSGPPELGAVDPHAVHDHGQPTRQRHDRVLHHAMPGDLHRPSIVADVPVNSLHIKRTRFSAHIGDPVQERIPHGLLVPDASCSQT